MTLELMETAFKRRGNFGIMTEIMGICKNGCSSTQIMFKANLSFTQLKQYLASLLEMGLLEKFEREGKRLYKSTNKGLEFMVLQQQIINLLNDRGQRCSSKRPLSGVILFPRNNSRLMF